MKWIMSFSKENNFNKKYWFYNLVVIIADLLALVPPILTGIIIDKGLIEKDINTAITVAIITIIIIIFYKLSAYLGVVFLSRSSNSLSKDIRVFCYNKLSYLDREYFNKTDLGEITTILTSDISTIRNYLDYTIKAFVTIVISFIISFSYGLSINAVLITTLLVVTPFMAIFYYRYNKNASRLYDERRDLQSILNNRIQENIEGNKIVKNYALENSEISKFKIDNQKFRNKNIEIVKNNNINFGFINFFAYLMDGILLFLGGIFCIQGKITVGNLVALYGIIWYIQVPFYEMGEILEMHNDFKTSLKRIKDLANTKSKIANDGAIELKDIKSIKFDNVYVKYEKKEGIKNFSLNIKEGEKIAFIGEVGSGKSTITNLLLRFVEPISGNIYINDIDIQDYELKSLRDKIGYVSQTPFLFSETVKENIIFGNRELKEEDIDKYIKMAKADYVYNLEKGINTVIGENGVTLSGGEKQRLTLVRALAVKPKLLILDDITSALDTETELEVTKNINELDYKCTKIIIAQKILSVKNADVICVLKDNEIVETGTHEELLKIDGHYREIYEIQINSIKIGCE